MDNENNVMEQEEYIDEPFENDNPDDIRAVEEICAAFDRIKDKQIEEVLLDEELNNLDDINERVQEILEGNDSVKELFRSWILRGVIPDDWKTRDKD